MISELRKIVKRRESLFLLIILLLCLWGILLTVKHEDKYEWDTSSGIMYENHMIERKQILERLKKQMEQSSSEYARKDLLYAFNCYNVSYDFAEYDALNTASGLYELTSNKVNVAFIFFFYCSHRSSLYL